MKQTGGFGAPKPLPGQAGYGAKEVDILEKEANEMEARLQILQERLKQQQMDSTAEVKSSASSSRWKSSKTEKGSIRSYGKEISDKAKKKTQEISASGLLSKSANVALKTSAQMQLQHTYSTPAPVAGDLSPSVGPSALQTPELMTQGPKPAAQWTQEDVSQWLTHLGLSQYAQSFADNEMCGSLLLDITLEDLDYMKVGVLAHRKLILRALDDLRQQQSTHNMKRAPSALLRASSASSSTRPLQHAHEPRQRIAMNDEDEDDAQEEEGAQVVGEAQRKQTPKQLHWSQVPPLTEQNPSASQRPPVNAADDGDIDEEAERRAFMQAVADWRSGGSSSGQQKGKVVSVRARYLDANDAETATSGREEDTSDTFAMHGGEWVNPFAPASSSSLPSAPRQSQSQSSSSARGYLQQEGVLDEAAEHAEFVKAVEAWRSQGQAPQKNAASKQPSSSTTSSSSTATTTTTTSSSSSTSSAVSAQTLAQSLATQLEEEQSAVAARIAQRRLEAEARLQQAASDLARTRQLRQQQNSVHSNDDDAKETGAADDKDLLRPPLAPSADEKPLPDWEEEETDKGRPQRREVHLDDSDILEEDDGQHGGHDDDDEEGDVLMHSVRIEFVESILHEGRPAEVETNEQMCVVEYASDSD